jgi:D-glycero-D-manno-heptose 1,7-bisphosphate phosphatase
MHKALFLDRDGVINVDRDYVHRIEDFEWQPGIFDLARTAVARGFLPVVVTNQSGIGRGYYSAADYEAVTAFMRERFEAEGAPLAAVYHCPFSPEAVRPEYLAADHPWRKPRPGMILAAREALGIDLASSLLIGDRASDIEAGASAGVGTLVLVGARVLRDQEPVRSALHFATVGDVARWFAEDFTRRL